MEHETCKSLADQLGEPYTAMKIGRIKKRVCDPEDYSERMIYPSGVLKITKAIKEEMNIIERGKGEMVKVKVLHHKTGNRHLIFAEDLETRRKVSVTVPMRQKRILSTAGKVLTVERGLKDGKFIYRYK